MGVSRADQVFDEIRRGLGYHVEAAKLDFALELKRAMDREKVTHAELAERLGVSRPMVSKLLGGDANVTIETMVKATRCLNSTLHLKMVRPQCTAHFFEVLQPGVSADAFRYRAGCAERDPRHPSAAAAASSFLAMTDEEQPLAA